MSTLFPCKHFNLKHTSPFLSAVSSLLASFTLSLSTPQHLLPAGPGTQAMLCVSVKYSIQLFGHTFLFTPTVSGDFTALLSNQMFFEAPLISLCSGQQITCTFITCWLFFFLYFFLLILSSLSSAALSLPIPHPTRSFYLIPDERELDTHSKSWICK